MEAPGRPVAGRTLMIRTLLRRGVSVLLLTFVLVGAAPAAAADWSLLERWDSGLWGWLASVWSADEAGEGDRGPGADPDGLNTGGDRGPELDPDGQTSEGDRGLEADPNE
jgi:hypothetical protein